MYFNHKNHRFVLLPSVTFSEEKGRAVEARFEGEKAPLIPYTCYFAFTNEHPSSSNSKPRKFKEMLSQIGNTLAC